MGFNTRVVRKKKIAILMPGISSVCGAIRQGFTDRLSYKQDIICNYTTYSTDANETLLKSYVDDVLSRRFDLIFSVGIQGTRVLSEAYRSGNYSTPVVFTGIRNFDEVKKINAHQEALSYFTGVVAERDVRLQMSLLFALKKDLKGVLLVYNPVVFDTQELQMKDEVEKILRAEKPGLTIRHLQVQTTEDIIQKVPFALPGMDILITLRDSTVFTGMEKLISLCNNHNVTLYASDLEAIKQGAALGFGFPESEWGKVAADKAWLIFRGVHPKNLPVTNLDVHYKFRINSQAMERQNLNIDPLLVMLIGRGQFLE